MVMPATTSSPIDVTVAAGAKEDVGLIVPMAVMTIALFAFAILLGVGVSKLVDYIHDRRALRDDASDMSEYTKNILKARFIMAFGKKSKESSDVKPEEAAKKAAAIWAKKTARGRAQRSVLVTMAGHDNEQADRDSMTSIDLSDIPLPPEDPDVLLHPHIGERTNNDTDTVTITDGKDKIFDDAKISSKTKNVIQDELPTKVSIEENITSRDLYAKTNAGSSKTKSSNQESKSSDQESKSSNQESNQPDVDTSRDTELSKEVTYTEVQPLTDSTDSAGNTSARLVQIEMNKNKPGHLEATNLAANNEMPVAGVTSEDTWAKKETPVRRQSSVTHKPNRPSTSLPAGKLAQRRSVKTAVERKPTSASMKRGQVRPTSAASKGQLRPKSAANTATK